MSSACTCGRMHDEWIRSHGAASIPAYLHLSTCPLHPPRPSSSECICGTELHADWIRQHRTTNVPGHLHLRDCPLQSARVLTASAFTPASVNYPSSSSRSHNATSAGAGGPSVHSIPSSSLSLRSGPIRLYKLDVAFYVATVEPTNVMDGITSTVRDLLNRELIKKGCDNAIINLEPIASAMPGLNSIPDHMRNRRRPDGRICHNLDDIQHFQLMAENAINKSGISANDSYLSMQLRIEGLYSDAYNRPPYLYAQVSHRPLLVFIHCRNGARPDEALRGKHVFPFTKIVYVVDYLSLFPPTPDKRIETVECEKVTRGLQQFFIAQIGLSGMRYRRGFNDPIPWSNEDRLKYVRELQNPVLMIPLLSRSQVAIDRPTFVEVRSQHADTHRNIHGNGRDRLQKEDPNGFDNDVAYPHITNDPVGRVCELGARAVTIYTYDHHVVDCSQNVTALNELTEFMWKYSGIAGITRQYHDRLGAGGNEMDFFASPELDELAQQMQANE